MRNTLFNIINYSYYFLIIILVTLYLFPGSIIGYFLYGDLGKQPIIIENPLGTSINHTLYFFFLSSLGLLIGEKTKKFISSLYFIFLLSILLEIFHLIVPNRAFEFIDLFGNILGVFMGLIFIKFLKWLGSI
ncbi:MAG: hypothetical protein CBD76_02225 [Pelagibacteraceae bacterium TMED216]|mgnify:CR=1 FL=1|nr:MAG: hypothetical protein CBD76_02225 [Pelagibacteraceae bacterium TMED216]|tara:strand:+ start:3885 stop:4280 length:396 start_codon:yes stop_codon:yes gene_type:complete